MRGSTFTINSINPWRSILFGSLGVLLPLALYLVPLEVMSVEFKTEYDAAIQFLLLLFMVLSIAGGYIGMRVSAYRLVISLDENGITQKIDPRLFILPKRKSTYLWSEVLNYVLTEDSKGKVLEISLGNHKKMTIGIAYILSDSGDFDAFYKEFLLLLNTFNEKVAHSPEIAIPIQKAPGFYQSKLAKTIAYILLLLMVGLVGLLAISGKTLSAWDLFRMAFFELLAALYVWRSLFGKK